MSPKMRIEIEKLRYNGSIRSSGVVAAAALRSHGPRIEVLVSASQTSAAVGGVMLDATANLLIDTGAAGSALSRRIIDSAGLLPLDGVRTELVGVTGDMFQSEEFDANIRFGMLDAKGRPREMSVSLQVMEYRAEAPGVDGYLGRDFLALFDLEYFGPTGRYSLVFTPARAR